MSFKLACWDKSGGNPAYNALRFASHDECMRYGKDLFFRWMGLDRYEVHESKDEVTYVFHEGRAINAIHARQFKTASNILRRYSKGGGHVPTFTKLSDGSTLPKRFAVISRDGSRVLIETTDVGTSCQLLENVIPSSSVSPAAQSSSSSASLTCYACSGEAKQNGLGQVYCAACGAIPESACTCRRTGAIGGRTRRQDRDWV